jgi:hypothetical protein
MECLLIADGVGHVIQAITAVDDGLELAVLHQVCQESQVRSAPLGLAETNFTACFTNLDSIRIGPCRIAACDLDLLGMIEDQIVPVLILGEVFACVVNDMVHSNGADQFQACGIGYCGDLRTEHLRNLLGAARALSWRCRPSGTFRGRIMRDM